MEPSMYCGEFLSLSHVSDDWYSKHVDGLDLISVTIRASGYLLDPLNVFVSDSFEMCLSLMLTDILYI